MAKIFNFFTEQRRQKNPSNNIKPGSQERSDTEKNSDLLTTADNETVGWGKSESVLLEMLELILTFRRSLLGQQILKNIQRLNRRSEDYRTIYLRVSNLSTEELERRLTKIKKGQVTAQHFNDQLVSFCCLFEVYVGRFKQLLLDPNNKSPAT